MGNGIKRYDDGSAQGVRTAPLPRLALSLLLVVACAIPEARAAKFLRVDFKYTSNQHIPPDERFVDVPGSPQDVAAMILAISDVGSPRILLDKKHNERIVVPENGAACYAKALEIHRQEWAAFAANKTRPYKRIDRSSGDCQDIRVTEDDGINGWLVKIELDSRSVDTALTHPILLVWIKETHHTLNLTSRLTFVLWEEEGQTRVYWSTCAVQRSVVPAGESPAPAKVVPAG